MTVNMGLKLPLFYGDPDNFPDETWEGYELTLMVNRLASGRTDFSDDMLKGQLLCNLRGKAQRFLESNPELLLKSYDEVKRILKDKYTNNGVQDLMQLHAVVQLPGESVSDFMTRLRRAAKPLLDRKPLLDMLERFKDKVDDWTPEMSQYAQEVGNVVRETLDTFLYHHFMRGLNDKIKNALGTAQPKDIYEAQNLAERQEKFLNLYVSSGSSRGRGLVNHTFTEVEKLESDEEDSSIEEESEDEEQYSKEKLKHRPKSREREPRSVSHERESRQVHQVEMTSKIIQPKQHKLVESKVRKDVDDFVEDRPYTACFACGHEGHFRSECFFNGFFHPGKLEFALEHGIRFPKPGSIVHNILTEKGIIFGIISK